jgi:hypothetical protein
MLHALLASFDQASTVVEAIGRLKLAGISPANLEVISSQPHPTHHFLPERSKTHIGAFALIGGALGAVAGFLLATLTALAYPLPTGGMPILSWWPIGIVTYETAMLGAVLATLVGLLAELKLPNLTLLPAETMVEDGLMIEIRCSEAQHLAIAPEIIASLGGRIIRGGKNP